MLWLRTVLVILLVIPLSAEVKTAIWRPCTADELLPQRISKSSSISHEWSDGNSKEQPFGCDCSFSKARYFCPSLGNGGYKTWEPRAIAEGLCESVKPFQLKEGPFPPNSKVLIYGNSHMRQVLEAALCVFPTKVIAKRVLYTFGTNETIRVIPGEKQCRNCSQFEHQLVENGCISSTDTADDACRCGDDHAEFYFSNGAVVHYFFSHIGKNKSVEDALGHHGDVTFEFYDVVVANSGNAPHLSASRVLDAALKMQAGRTTFFWFSSYDGAGDIKKWTHSNQAVFHQSGAKFVAMGDMARGLDHLTVGAVENRRDPHFCLPGPPNEIGLLLVKMIWAIHQENEMQ